MENTMAAIEMTGSIDENHQLQLVVRLKSF